MLFIVCSLLTIVAAKRNRNSSLWQEPEEFESNLNNSRHIFYSCIICSYSYLTQPTNEELLAQILGSHYDENSDPILSREKQQSIWKRLQIDGVKYCANKQTIENAQKMYNDLQTQKFRISSYLSIMEGFNFTHYEKGTPNLIFDKTEETLWQMMEDFYTNLKNDKSTKTQILGEDFDDSDLNLTDDEIQEMIDPTLKVFGIPVREGLAGYILLGSVFTLFFLILLCAHQVLKKAQDAPQKQPKKGKKSKMN